MSSRRQFELLRELGAGTFGTVYLADMVSLGGFRKRVALKLLNSQWDESSDAGQRLRDEARLLGRLRHRHIVQVDDLVRVQGQWGVVMEYIPGADLERVLLALGRQESRAGGPDEGLFPEAAAGEIALAVAGALRAAFEGDASGDAHLAVVHRDIKPSNVLLTAEGEVKVLDFGIAQASFQGREARTGRIRLGSMPYMSPERVLGEPEGPAGDLYALGCVLYELLAGRPLGRAELSPERHAAQTAQALQQLTAARPDLSVELLALLDEMLRYDIADRPAASAVVSRLRALQSSASGEDLRSFAGRVIPRIDELIGESSRAVSGVLSEEDTHSVPPSDLPRFIQTPGSPSSATPTLAPTTNTPFDEEPPAAAPSPAPPAPRRGIASLAATVIGAGVVAGLGIWLLLPRTHEPPVVPPPSAVSVRPTPDPIVPPPVDPPEPPNPVTGTMPSAVLPAGTALPALEAAANPRPAQAIAPPRSNNPAQSPPQTPAPVVETPDPDPPEAGERVRAVKFTAPGATRIAARCGDVSNAGTTSVVLRNVPTGACSVSATLEGAVHAASAQVQRADGFLCSLEGGALQCR